MRSKHVWGWACICCFIGMITLLAIFLGSDPAPRSGPDPIPESQPPEGFFIPDGMGERVVLTDHSSVNMSVSPPNKGCRLASIWKVRSANVCAEIRLDPKPTNSTVFAMYAISGEVDDRETEPWWELDFEFLGRSPDAVWINWFQAGRVRPDAKFYALTPSPRNRFRRFCLEWDIGNRTAIWRVDTVEIERLEMDSTWNASLSLIFSHWVGHGRNAEWVGGDSIDATHTAIVRDLSGDVREL